MERRRIITRVVARIESARPATARKRSGGARTRAGRRRVQCIAAVAVGCGLLLAGAVAPSAADTTDDLDLGPQVTRTDEGPTGYSVTFRYKAPDDVEQVRIWGEWQFSSVESLVNTRTSDGRMGWDWRPGDTVAAAGTGFFPAFPASDMTLGEDGVWTWTTPLPSGMHSYRFVHDCGGPAGIDGCTYHYDPANPPWSVESSRVVYDGPE